MHEKYEQLIQNLFYICIKLYLHFQRKKANTFVIWNYKFFHNDFIDVQKMPLLTIVLNFRTIWWIFKIPVKKDVCRV